MEFESLFWGFKLKELFTFILQKGIPKLESTSALFMASQSQDENPGCQDAVWLQVVETQNNMT